MARRTNVRTMPNARGMAQPSAMQPRPGWLVQQLEGMPDSYEQRL